jgi:hypothetical protein
MTAEGALGSETASIFSSGIKIPELSAVKTVFISTPKSPPIPLPTNISSEISSSRASSESAFLDNKQNLKILITQADINLIEEKRQFVEDMIVLIKKLNHFIPKKRDIFSIIFSYPHAT